MCRSTYIWTNATWRISWWACPISIRATPVSQRCSCSLPLWWTSPLLHRTSSIPHRIPPTPTNLKHINCTTTLSFLEPPLYPLVSVYLFSVYFEHVTVYCVNSWLWCSLHVKLCGMCKIYSVLSSKGGRGKLPPQNIPCNFSPKHSSFPPLLV